jgi:hypothetical protein
MNSIQEYYAEVVEKYLKVYKWVLEVHEDGLYQFLSFRSNNRILLDFHKTAVTIDYYEDNEVYNDETFDLYNIKAVDSFLNVIMSLGERLS